MVKYNPRYEHHSYVSQLSDGAIELEAAQVRLIRQLTFDLDRRLQFLTDIGRGSYENQHGEYAEYHRAVRALTNDARSVNFPGNRYYLEEIGA